MPQFPAAAPGLAHGLRNRIVPLDTIPEALLEQLVVDAQTDVTIHEAVEIQLEVVFLGQLTPESFQQGTHATEELLRVKILETNILRLAFLPDNHDDVVGRAIRLGRLGLDFRDLTTVLTRTNDLALLEIRLSQLEKRHELSFLIT